MSAKILTDKDGYACLYCSTTEVAFGPIFYPDEDVESFLKWLVEDPRHLTHEALSQKVSEWRMAILAERES
jgi:hypothetical protein